MYHELGLQEVVACGQSQESGDDADSNVAVRPEAVPNRNRKQGLVRHQSEHDQKELAIVFRISSKAPLVATNLD